jgi:hypothetical protein
MIEYNEQLDQQWALLANKLRQSFKKLPDLNAVLYLIGVQELGTGPKNFSKEEKQDLMHIAVCKVLSLSNYYTLKGTDENGWPHWELAQPLPPFDLLSQERFLKAHIIQYFQQEVGL